MLVAASALSAIVDMAAGTAQSYSTLEGLEALRWATAELPR